MFRNLRFMLFILSVFIWTPVFSQPVAENSTPRTSCCENIEEQRSSYFKENRYNEFVDFLSNSKEKSNFPVRTYVSMWIQMIKTSGFFSFFSQSFQLARLSSKEKK